MIEKILSKLGLAEKDIHIYLALVKLGPSSASTIAKEVNLPRQTIYSILEQLVVREFVEQSDKRGVKHFFADPSKLTELIEKQKKLLNEQQEALEKELPKLLALQVRKEPLLKLQYYEGVAGMQRLLNSILDLFKKGKGKEFRGYGVNRFREAFPDEYFYDFVKKRAAYGVNTRIMIGQGPDDFGITPETIYGRKIKRLEMNPQHAVVYIAGNRVYLFSFEERVGVMIESISISQLLTVVFDDHWKKT